jgi:hypothetical protein
MCFSSSARVAPSAKACWTWRAFRSSALIAITSASLSVRERVPRHLRAPCGSAWRSHLASGSWALAGPKGPPKDLTPHPYRNNRQRGPCSSPPRESSWLGEGVCDRIWDGTMRRGVAETPSCATAAVEGTHRVPLPSPPCTGRTLVGPVYHIRANNYVMIVAGHDLAGPLPDLARATTGRRGIGVPCAKPRPSTPVHRLSAIRGGVQTG